MKKVLTISAITVMFLIAVEAGDSVAKKEAAVLANPAETTGAHAAKAKVEEAQSKLEMEAKMERESFVKEAKEEVKKSAMPSGSGMKDSVAKKEAAAISESAETSGSPAAKAEVEEAQEKSEFKTKMDREAFEKEAKHEMMETEKK